MDQMARETIRLAVYRVFAASGLPPTLGGLQAMTGMDLQEVRQALRDLHDSRDLVLGADGQIVMAHPFSSIPLGFSVMGEQTLWWGGCAWDSFAIPHLVDPEPPMLVATRCPNCSTPDAWNVGRDDPPEGDQVAHFLTPTQHIWDDVVFACSNQSIFCDIGCVDAWLAKANKPRGYVMDLGTLWRLASGWYEGRLEYGYVRREPVEAASYFAEVGLRGPFWGLT